MKPATPEAYRLMHDGCVVLSELEANGMAIDVKYLDGAIEKTTAKIDRLRASLLRSKIGLRWKRRFGDKMNIGSSQQLGVMLFEELGYECKYRTATDAYKVDDTALGEIDHPFVRRYGRMQALAKAVGTYLTAIRREMVGGFIHPFLHLHTAVSYRSSSESPNIQNMPIRDPTIGRLVRRAFIPRKRHNQLVEMDFSGAEVRVSACYHQDPAMIKYILDPTKDLHRDMAMELFMLSRSQVNKETRFSAKSNFIFAQFYGSWWTQCAPHLWRDIEYMHLRTESGTPIKKHLKRKGISGLGELGEGWEVADGTFLAHVRDVEEDFWGRRFRVYAQWRKDIYAEYLRRGFIRTLTGFVCQGFMHRNDVINYGTQGAAFHCLLWMLIYMARAIQKYKMKAKLINEIHDSFLGDVPTTELRDYVDIAHDGLDKLNRTWRWLVVPMISEFEAAPPGASWADKTKYGD